MFRMGAGVDGHSIIDSTTAHVRTLLFGSATAHCCAVCRSLVEFTTHAWCGCVLSTLPPESRPPQSTKTHPPGGRTVYNAVERLPNVHAAIFEKHAPEVGGYSSSSSSTRKIPPLETLESELMRKKNITTHKIAPESEGDTSICVIEITSFNPPHISTLLPRKHSLNNEHMYSSTRSMWFQCPEILLACDFF